MDVTGFATMPGLPALRIDTGQGWTYLVTTGMESPATPRMLMTPVS